MAEFSSRRHVGRMTAYEAVLSWMREAILTGEYAPGARLIQSQIAAEHGMSNTPVREAMRQLHSDGLITFDDYRGAVVREQTADEVTDLYAVRLLLEPPAIALACRTITVDALDAAEELRGRMSSSQDIADWVFLNREFHGMLVEPCGNSYLLAAILPLQDAATPQVARSLRIDHAALERSDREHSALLAAMRDRDEVLASEIIRRHLGSTMSTLEGLREGESETAP